MAGFLLAALRAARTHAKITNCSSAVTQVMCAAFAHPRELETTTDVRSYRGGSGQGELKSLHQMILMP